MGDLSQLQEEIADLEALGLNTAEMNFWDVWNAHGRLLNDSPLTQRCLANGNRIIRLEQRREEIEKMSPAERDALRERILAVPR